MKGSVRDFHDELFTAKFPKNLYQIIESVQLIVNGWIILDENFNKVDWRIDESPWLNFITPEVAMYSPINKGHPERPPISQWTLNLYDKLPMYVKEFSSTQWVGSLADELRMLRR